MIKLAETFCKPNSVVTVVPAGLPVVLQYNEHGLLQKVTVGWEGTNLEAVPQTTNDPTVNDAELSQKLFKAVSGHVPTSILTKGGTTWVYGVMYSPRIPCDEGLLPQSLINSYIKSIISGDAYTFYAGYVNSLATLFQGPVIIRNFLSSAGFKELPQVIVPMKMTEATLSAALSRADTNFDPNFIIGFFVYDGLKCHYVATHLEQITVKADPALEIDENGFWRGSVESVSTGKQIKFHYSAILHYKLAKGVTAVMDVSQNTHTILATRVGEDAGLVPLGANENVKCPVCGKLCLIGMDTAPFQCDDPNCVSHCYPDAVKMLKTLDLEELSFEDYKKAVDAKDIICLTDVLELPQYKDIEIETTLANALYSVIPASVVPNFAILERFANKCNNNAETVKYYLDSPLRIQTDLDIVDPMVAKLAEWLSSPANKTTVLTIFDRVSIVGVKQKFDGLPIFRGNTIAITGKFKRGDQPEIESILRSYQADVITSIEPGQDLPDVVVIGGMNDGISGQMIQKAKVHGIPTIEEDEFFISYEIDQDLEENLL